MQIENIVIIDEDQDDLEQFLMALWILPAK